MPSNLVQYGCAIVSKFIRYQQLSTESVVAVGIARVQNWFLPAGGCKVADLVKEFLLSLADSSETLLLCLEIDWTGRSQLR